MKILIAGKGIQGQKRFRILKKRDTKTVDSNKNKKPNYTHIKEVPLNSYDAIFCCVPEKEKKFYLNHCLKFKKNILIEKPLILKNKEFDYFKKNFLKKKLVCYTAYNHRFEPSIIDLKKIIKKNLLGQIYKINFFYGNGTSKIVKKSKWRDKGLGVIADIGSHLVDISLYLLGDKSKISNISLDHVNYFENKSPDNALFSIQINKIKIYFEVTLCSWKNTFKLDVIGSKGSAHIDSLCKWSDSALTVYKRVFPVGYPRMIIRKHFKKGDPTWNSEHKYFKKLNYKSSLQNFIKDIKITEFFKSIKI